MGNCKSSDKNVSNRKINLAILGLDNAGKTLMAKALKGETPDDTTPTIGFSSVTINFEGNDITLYDLGGGKSIRDIWKKYFHEIYGVIFVIDASDPKRLKDSQEEIIKLLSNDLIKGKPLLVFANKQDIKGAMDEKDICDNLYLEDLVTKHQTPCKVESCSAMLRHDKKKFDDSIKIGFQWMMKIINLKWQELSTRVANDITEKIEIEKSEKIERIKRVKRNQELRDDEEAKSSSRRKSTNRSDDEIDSRVSKNKFSTNPWQPLDQHIQKVEATQNGKVSNGLKLNSSYDKLPSARLTPRLDKLQLEEDDYVIRDKYKKDKLGINNNARTNSNKPNGILTSGTTPRKSSTMEDLSKSYTKVSADQKVVKKTRFTNKDHHQLISDNDYVSESDNSESIDNHKSYHSVNDKKSTGYDRYADKKENNKGKNLLPLEDTDSEEELKPSSRPRFDNSEDDDDEDDRYKSNTKYKTDYRKTTQYTR